MLCLYAGKAFSYFASQQSWIQEVFYHPIEDNTDVCLLKSKCIPSQRVNHVQHVIWICIRKSTGVIEKAYCSCMAGLVKYCTQYYSYSILFWLQLVFFLFLTAVKLYWITVQFSFHACKSSAGQGSPVVWTPSKTHGIHAKSTSLLWWSGGVEDC